MPEPKTMKVPCCYPACTCFKTVDPTEAMHDEPIHWLCKIHKHHMYKPCQYGGCEKIYFPTAEVDLSNDGAWYCEPHKIAIMIDESRCDFMDCKLQGRFTDPSLGDKKYCEHHRRVVIDSNKEQAHRDEVTALKKQIDGIEAEKQELIYSLELLTRYAVQTAKKAIDILPPATAKYMSDTIEEVIKEHEAKR